MPCNYLCVMRFKASSLDFAEMDLLNFEAFHEALDEIGDDLIAILRSVAPERETSA